MIGEREGGETLTQAEQKPHRTLFKQVSTNQYKLREKLNRADFCTIFCLYVKCVLFYFCLYVKCVKVFKMRQCRRGRKIK